MDVDCFNVLNVNWGVYNGCNSSSVAFAKLLKRLSASSCLSVRIEQLGPLWTDVHEILYLSIFRKSVEKVKDLLKYDKETHIYIFYHIWPTSSQNERCFSQKLYGKSKHNFMFNNFFFPKILQFMR